MEVSKSTKKKLFVGLTGPDTTNHSLRCFFENELTVHIAKVEISRRSGKKKGFAYITYDNLPGADSKFPAVGILDNKKVFIASYDDSLTAAWHRVRQQSIQITITGIPSYMPEIEVVRLLEVFGTVIVSNFTGGCRKGINPNSLVMLVEMVRDIDSLKNLAQVWKQIPGHSISHVWDFKNLLASSNHVLRSGTQKSISLSDLDKVFGLTKTISIPSIETIPVTQKSLQDKHSKYEFCKLDDKLSHRGDNYRFNILTQSCNPSSFGTPQDHKVISTWGSIVLKKTLTQHYLNL